MGASPSGRALRLLLRDAPWWLALVGLLVAAPVFTELMAAIAALWAAAALLSLAARSRPLHALPATTGEVVRLQGDQRA